MNQRALAATVLHDVIQNRRSLPEALTDLPTDLEAQQRKFIQELCYGVVRWYFQLHNITHYLLNTPLKNKDADIGYLIYLGLYQLTFLDTPSYAAINSTVEATKQIKKPWATGLVNKLLRKYNDNKTYYLNLCQRQTNTRFSQPDWFIEAIKNAWPNDWQMSLQQLNEKPPLFIRVNQQLIRREDYSNVLTQHNIEHSLIEAFPQAIEIKNPVPVTELPKFNLGLCSVQDLAGQKVIELLELKPKLRVLDACAAPGSKTCHILETQPQLEKLIAIDQDPARMLKLKDNVNRLRLPHHALQLVLADAAHTQEWWDGHHFHRVLLDAPCSATGVIRRHPDIKLLRQKSDIAQSAQLQLRLLNALWPTVMQGGKLIYTTCSILPDENQHVIQKFLNKQSHAKLIKLDKTFGIDTQYGSQLLPNNPFRADGFFYCVIEKIKK